MEQEKRICSCCGNELSIDNFSFRGQIGKDGLPKRRKICRACVALKDKDRRKKKTEKYQCFVNALLEYCRYEVERLQNVDKQSFEHFVGQECEDFDSVKNSAMIVLISQGLYSEDKKEFGDGNYLICGDSFGKHTKTKMFVLLEQIIKYLDINKVIHVGEALDDDNEVSNLWKTLSADCYFVAKANELQELYNQQKLYGFNVIKDYIMIGDVKVVNQEAVQPYTTKSLSNLDSYIYNYPTITNCTRHEYFSRNHFDGEIFTASPGTLAKPFVKKVVKTFSFTDGFKSKMCYSNNFIKYRRMKEVAENYWQNGIIIARVRDGKTYINMVRIKNNGDDYFTVTDTRVFDTNNEESCGYTSSVVLADAHAPYEDVNAMSLVNSVVYNNNFCDRVVALGDMVDGKSVNPHTNLGSEGDALSEIIAMNKIFVFIENYGKEKIALEGNHFNFYERFFKRGFASLRSLGEKIYKSILDNCKFKFIPIKTPYFTEDTVYWHGSELFFGQNGSQQEKLAKNFKQSTVVYGHTHSPSIRYDSYSIPCLCKLDQGYNTPANSNWGQGFAVVYEYKGYSFCQIIPFRKKESGLSCFFDNELYIDINGTIYDNYNPRTIIDLTK